jgi:small-conductance mechanosensitive channel
VRDTIENYFASILLSLRQPFRPNELVSIDGREGRVLRLNSRATLLMDLDGNHVRIPNALVYKATIVNYDSNPFRRFSFGAAVDPRAPLAEVLRVAETALADTPGVVREPPPIAIVETFGDWATNIMCHAWVDQRDVDLPKTRSAALVAIQAAFERAGVDMPVPSYSIAMQRPEEAVSREGGAQQPTPQTSDVQKIDVRRNDPTKPFRERDEGENLLAQHGRSE